MKVTEDKIKENAADLEMYLKKVSELRSSEIETIREMTNEITPVFLPADGSASSRASSVDVNTQIVQNKNIFRGQLDMKLRILQRGASLKEITTFSASFVNCPSLSGFKFGVWNCPILKNLISSIQDQAIPIDL